jgi:hypothetical protein
MDTYLRQISGLIKAASDGSWFLDMMFGACKQEALNGVPVVLFGAGELGEQIMSALNHNGIFPVCFCDNDVTKRGQLCCGIPIISFDELIVSHRNSLIVVSTLKYMEAISNQLLENGFCEDRVFCKDVDRGTRVLFSYSAFIARALTECDLYSRIAKADLMYRNTIEKLRSQLKIKVAFFVHFVSIWKYDDIYRLMLSDDRFDPVIVVVPYLNSVDGEDNTIKDIEDTFNYFKKRNYNVISTYDSNTDEWLDVKNEVCPDVVFFTNPFEAHNKADYYITRYLDCLTCYATYSFIISHAYSFNYSQPFYNLLWKAFYETPAHMKLAMKYAQNGGRNVVIAGYPGTDKFIDKTYLPEDVWKIKNRNIKRIIWAPHHTIHDIERDKCLLGFSNFMAYHELMLDIADKYSDRIQIAFKPHPILRRKLYCHENWGKSKTDSYYSKWENMVNGQLEEFEYVDLFLASDAMILDSGSFMTEYLYLGKPSLFTVRDEKLTERFNIFGKMVFDQLYHANNGEDIISFIEDVVVQCNDPKRETRLRFFNDYLRPPNNRSASENIFEIIKASLT